jgi:magnesium chelatase accessory protein
MRGPDFDRDGRNWPHRSTSRFTDAGLIHWHIQIMGDQSAPVVLLVHGTGAATHSWRHLAPLLANEYCVVAMDLPGHGFTSFPRDSNLDESFSVNGMARGLGALMTALSLKPKFAIGHSAGACIITRMALNGLIQPDILIGLNAAMRPMPILPARFFTSLAKMAAIAPMMPEFFAWRASDMRMVRRLIEGTGSHLDDEGLQLYRFLGAQPRHVEAAFRMMANWNLEQLYRDLPKLKMPMHFIVGDDDRAIAPSDSKYVARQISQSKLHHLPGLGHLAHEESASAVAGLIAGITLSHEPEPAQFAEQGVI